MKIIFSSAGKDLDSEVDPRFGRAQNFLLVDSDTGEYEAIDNAQNVNMMSGAGIQTAETVVNSGAEVVITGHCGPKAFRTLNAAAIKIVIGAEGKIRDALDKFKKGEYQYTDSPNVQGHW